ncbi:MAG: hypothetical protein JRH16_02430 [Deltaproteobacteria bacterium]|nr:hypothetical protein [Deltaproteobacteria bacterium]
MRQPGPKPARCRMPRGDTASWCSVLALLCLLAAGLAGARLAGALPSRETGLAARLAGNDGASEHWDLMARFTSGHALFVRTMLTNAGPGSNTAIVIGQLVFPDGDVFDFDNGRREGRWRAAPDGLFIKVGGSELDLHEPERSFSKHSSKSSIQLDARFAARPTHQAEGDGEPGVAATAIAPIESTFQVGKMPAPVSVEGVVMLRHAWSRTSESKHTRRWIDVIAGDTHDGVVIWGFENPQGERRQWLSRTRDGAPALETTAFELAPEGASGPEPAYPVPRRIELRGARLDGHLEFGGELVRVDPMGIIPQPFRWFLSREIAPRRILSRAQLHLEPGDDSPGFDAPALVGITWTLPLL